VFDDIGVSRVVFLEVTSKVTYLTWPVNPIWGSVLGAVWVRGSLFSMANSTRWIAINQSINVRTRKSLHEGEIQ